MTESAAHVRVIEETPAYWRVVLEYPAFNIKDEGRARGRPAHLRPTRVAGKRASGRASEVYG